MQCCREIMAGGQFQLMARDVVEIAATCKAKDPMIRRRRIFLNLVAMGVPVKYAAWRSFISIGTINGWINPGSWTFDQIFRELYQAARGEAVTRRVKKLNDSPDWKAHAFLLQGVAEEFAPKKVTEAPQDETTKKSGRIVMDAQATKALSVAYDKARAEREAKATKEAQENE